MKAWQEAKGTGSESGSVTGGSHGPGHGQESKERADSVPIRPHLQGLSIG